MDSSITLFNTYAAKVNKKLKTNFHGNDYLFTKIFSRKLFRDADLKNIFKALFDRNWEKQPANHPNRTKLILDGKYIIVFEKDTQYIVSMTDKKNNY